MIKCDTDILENKISIYQNCLKYRQYNYNRMIGSQDFMCWLRGLWVLHVVVYILEFS